MKLEVRDGAVQDLKQMSKPVQQQIRTEIEKLKQNPLGENTSLLNKQGLEIFRLKIKERDLDHRVFFNIDNTKIIVLGIKHRDQAYTPESLQKIRSRKD
jgi:mRNA-degrading endonuclease RelE of RelBE toxin-antitoxin system